MFNPRPMQAEILNYTGGRMGVSAVPGSGKTHTLSSVSYTHLRAHETPEHLVCRLLLEKKTKQNSHYST